MKLILINIIINLLCILVINHLMKEDITNAIIAILVCIVLAVTNYIFGYYEK